MTTDPKDTEIARLHQQWEDQDAAWSERVAMLTAALAESEAAAEGALMILVQTQAERDAALAQVALLPLADLLKAARELAGYASYAEIVGGLSVNKPQVREWCDKVFEVIRSLPVDQDFEPTASALAALSRRDAQIRAEGRKEGLRELDALADEIGEARLLLDTGAVLIGLTVDYEALMIEAILGKLDRVITALRAKGVR